MFAPNTKTRRVQKRTSTSTGVECSNKYNAEWLQKPNIPMSSKGNVCFI